MTRYVLRTIFLLIAAAAGYVFAPSAMLAVVGIESTPVAAFLVRTLAAAFLGILPMAWAVRKRTGSGFERPILWGLAIYMFAGSVVDLLAFVAGLVGGPAIPSIIMRVGLGGALVWLAL